MITVKEFLQQTRATSWYEAHWSLAASLEQAQHLFSKHGLYGTIYQVPFGFWLVPEKGMK